MTERRNNDDVTRRKSRWGEKKRRTKKRKRIASGSAFRSRIFLRIILILILTVFSGWRIWRSDMVQMRFVYMWPYQNEILNYAEKNQIDPFLVAAVIKNESRFKPGAVSEAGAIGLMQIMPETGEWIAGQMGLSGYNVQKLYDPESNIRMGCWYLSELKHEFRGNMVLQILAYNAGRGNTHGWIAAHGWDGEFGAISSIPYEESRNYVAAVLHDRDEYYRLYKDKIDASGKNRKN